MKTKTKNKTEMTYRQAIFFPFFLIGTVILFGMVAFNETREGWITITLFGIIGILIFLIGITEKSKTFNFAIRLYYIILGLFLCLPIIQSIYKSLNFL